MRAISAEFKPVGSSSVYFVIGQWHRRPRSRYFQVSCSAWPRTEAACIHSLARKWYRCGWLCRLCFNCRFSTLTAWVSPRAVKNHRWLVHCALINIRKLTIKNSLYWFSLSHCTCLSIRERPMGARNTNIQLESRREDRNGVSIEIYVEIRSRKYYTGVKKKTEVSIFIYLFYERNAGIN